MEPENDVIQNESPFPGFASFKLNFQGAHLRLRFQWSIFTPKIGAQMKQNSTQRSLGSLGSLHLQMLKSESVNWTLRSQKALKRVTKRVISLKLQQEVSPVMRVFWKGRSLQNEDFRCSSRFPYMSKKSLSFSMMGSEPRKQLLKLPKKKHF